VSESSAIVQLSGIRLKASISARISPPGYIPGVAPLLKIPAPGTEDDDRNPPRIAARNLFDMSGGWDNLFHADRFKINTTFSVTNLTNKVALYNFLSTFSGTHFVPPRAYSAGLTLNF